MVGDLIRPSAGINREDETAFERRSKMRSPRYRGIAGSCLAGILLAGCAEADNPTALSDLDPVAEFDISVNEIETMHEVEITARVSEGGAPMHLRDVRLEVQPPHGPTQVLELAGDESGYEGHVRFYEAGEHHLHLLGKPERHHVTGEMGELEIEVEAQHQIHDERRFELAVSPAPIIPGVIAQVTLYVWELDHDGGTGHEAEELELHATLHLPGDVEVPVEFHEDEHGEYVATLVFPRAGSYELSVEVEEGEHAEHSVTWADPDEDHDAEAMEFEIYVPALFGDAPPPEEGDDDGHDH